MPSMDDGNNLPTTLYALSVIFSVLPTIAVALRFQSRRMTKSRLHNDDWTILLSLVSCLTTAVLVIIGVAAGGMGQHLKRSPNGEPIYDHQYIIFQKIMYGIDLTQLLAIGPTKLSVLLFYRRIFEIEGRRFKILSMSLIVLVIVWTTAFFLTNALQCYPVETFWAQNPKDQRPIMKTTRMFLSQSYADVALDVVIISLPVPLIWKLIMDLRKKLIVSCIFLLGILTTAASVARTVVQYGVAKEFDRHNLDKTYYLCPIIYWPLIEAALGIVGACLPMLRPIGRIYSFERVFRVPARAISTVLVNFTRSYRYSSQRGSSKSDPEGCAPDGASSKSDNWLNPYNISLLRGKVDHESQVEVLPMTAIHEHNFSRSAIVLERGYEVNRTET